MVDGVKGMVFDVFGTWSMADLDHQGLEAFGRAKQGTIHRRLGRDLIRRVGARLSAGDGQGAQWRARLEPTSMC